MRTEHVSFPVDGVVVDATLTLPADAAPKPVPAVLTGAGFAGVKEMLMPDYSRDFAAGGVASLTFDYPGFGRSGGHPRQHVDPAQQVRTFRAALDRLTADPRIDPTRLAVWGTSLSGGHALVLAATDPRINAVAAIIPFIHLTPTAKPDLLPLLARDALRRLTRRPGLMIPAAGHPGEAAAMNSDGAFEWAADMAQGAATYRNEVTVASLPNMLRWSTRKAASNIGSRPGHPGRSRHDHPATAGPQSAPASTRCRVRLLPRITFRAVHRPRRLGTRDHSRLANHSTTAGGPGRPSRPVAAQVRPSGFDSQIVAAESV